MNDNDLNLILSEKEKRKLKEHLEQIEDLLFDISVFYKIMGDVEKLKPRKDSLYKTEMLRSKFEFLRFIKKRIKEDMIRAFQNKKKIAKKKNLGLENIEEIIEKKFNEEELIDEVSLEDDVLRKLTKDDFKIVK